MVAFIDLHPSRAVIARVEHALEECELQRPRGFGLLTAIPAGDGIVEPTARSTRIALERIALVATIETITPTAYVGERDHMVGLAENAEKGTFHRGNDLIQRTWTTR